MGFVETKVGLEICNKASMLLGRMLKKKKQYTLVCQVTSCSGVIDAELDKGARFVDKICDGTGYVVLIFEKTED